MSEPAINITKHFSAVHGSMHSSAGTANRRKSIADVVVLDDTSSSSDEVSSLNLTSCTTQALFILHNICMCAVCMHVYEKGTLWN